MTVPPARFGRWVQLTRLSGSMPDPANMPVWINLDEVVSLGPVQGGTQVHFTSAEWLIVAETVEQILGTTP